IMPKAAMNTRSSRSELVDDEAMDIDELTHVARRESIVRDFNTLRTRGTKVFRERANGFASKCESVFARSMASGNQRAISWAAPRLLWRSKLPLLKPPQAICFRIRINSGFSLKKTRSIPSSGNSQSISNATDPETLMVSQG